MTAGVLMATPCTKSLGGGTGGHKHGGGEGRKHSQSEVMRHLRYESNETFFFCNKPFLGDFELAYSLCKQKHLPVVKSGLTSAAEGR